MEHELATAPEWRIFEAVQPLFAADLPWRLVDTQRSDPVHADAVGIDIKKMKDIFQSEMQFLPLSLPDQDISTKAFALCIRELKDLLRFLESLVLHRVIAAAGELTEQLDNKEEDEHTPSNPTSESDDRLWFCRWWFGSPPTDPPPVSTPSRSPAVTTKPSEAPPSRPLYEKLEALRTVAENSRCEGNPMVNSCTRFLKLDHTLQEFTTGVSAAVYLNKRLQGLSKPPSSAVFQSAEAQAVSKTKWESGMPWGMLERLFRFLVESSCSQHHARLKLNGFQLDKCSSSSPPINMFMSSCLSQTYWQDCQCVSILSDPITLSSDGRVALNDVCEYIAASVRHRPARLLSVGFNDRLLLHLPENNESSIHAGHSQMVSFEEILDQGLLREPGGMLDMNDKAVLALSLARCLLHLATGPWAQQKWTRSNVHFLGEIEDIRDVWHPYVTCPIAEDTASQSATPVDIVSLFSSFAQLLVELETGDRVTLEPGHGDLEDTIAAIQEQKMAGCYARGYYNEAVTGCFQVNAAMRKAMRQASKTQQDPKYLIRKAIYDTVVSRLERNFLQISTQAMPTILRNLSQGKRATRSGVYIPLGGHRNEAHTQISQCGGSTSAFFTVSGAYPDIAQSDTGICDSVSDNYENLDGGFDADLNNASPTRGIRITALSTMFFDGESSNVRNRTVRFADTFFNSFDEFRKRYIVPNFQSEENGKARVRIAILDTGINSDDLRSRLDRVSAIRKNQNCPRNNRCPIKAIKSFIGDVTNSEGDSCERGHGTHVASILLRLAPDADLYIAKVSTGEQHFDNPGGIAKAIYWATDECKVDIINMSFGSRLRSPTVQRAIAHAKERKPSGVLLFAAASNFGKNEPMMYPASDSNVMGVHALDGHGNDSGWTNPSPVGPHHNFGTLGLGIEMLWKEKIIYKSGSSFASPTAAAIAANMIDWLYHMKQRGSLTYHQYNFLRQSEGMRQIFKLQAVKSGDVWSVTPWKLFMPHLEEEDPDFVVCARIKHDIPSFRLEEEEEEEEEEVDQ
ncbi:hypothetical protein BHE90_004563 [Fusarium euwallaceae]|uniref:Uncharacterized protein n=1 Tax=Fusarium euwallaceae TaxID=1147111 RepID=A0A430LYY3_9HYPO|nr:hypothetical protein BHE90_004563 [Fusarium euwallaceae]